jgi:ATPase subunit of ABC transporter with duplicated ATPase domains
MDAIVELTSLGASRYGGNWSLYRARKAVELAAAEHDRAEAEHRLAAAARARQEAVERQARRDGAGKRKAGKGDMPRIVLGGLQRQAQATAGRLTRLGDGRQAAARQAADAARRRIEILAPFAVTLAPSGLAAGRQVLILDRLTVGYTLGEPMLRDLSFEIVGPQRVAVTGPNGAGKTTLVAVLAGALPPWSGRAEVRVPFALLDQQVGILDPAATIRDNFRRLNPEAGENACRAALARFMFRAEAALQPVGTLSGREAARRPRLRARRPGAAAAGHPRRAEQPSRHRRRRDGGSGACRL